MFLTKLYLRQESFTREPLIFTYVIFKFNVSTLVAMILICEHSLTFIHKSALVNSLNYIAFIALYDFEVFLAFVQQMVAECNRAI